MCRVAIIASTLFLLVSAVGCTHTQLRKRTNQQLRTTSEITQQQVLDNVAATVVNPNAWPEFSNFASGVTQVTDNIGSNVSLVWNPTTLVSEALGVNGGRQLVEKWDTKATTDPDRLRAMATILHYAVYGTTPLTAYYDGALHMQQIFGDRWQAILPTPGWFAVERDVKRVEKVYCGCLIGHYCDTHVCVATAGQADLQQLTYLVMYVSSVTFTRNGGPAAFPNGIPEATATGPFQAARGPEDLQTGPAKDFNSFSPGPALTPSF